MTIQTDGKPVTGDDRYLVCENNKAGAIEFVKEKLNMSAQKMIKANVREAEHGRFQLFKDELPMKDFIGSCEIFPDEAQDKLIERHLNSIVRVLMYGYEGCYDSKNDNYYMSGLRGRRIEDVELVFREGCMFEMLSYDNKFIINSELRVEDKI